MNKQNLLGDLKALQNQLCAEYVRHANTLKMANRRHCSENEIAEVVSESGVAILRAHAKILRVSEIISAVSTGRFDGHCCDCGDVVTNERVLILHSLRCVACESVGEKAQTTYGVQYK